MCTTIFSTRPKKEILWPFKTVLDLNLTDCLRQSGSIFDLSINRATLVCRIGIGYKSKSVFYVIVSSDLRRNVPGRWAGRKACTSAHRGIGQSVVPSLNDVRIGNASKICTVWKTDSVIGRNNRNTGSDLSLRYQSTNVWEHFGLYTLDSTTIRSPSFPHLLCQYELNSAKNYWRWNFPSLS